MSTKEEIDKWVESFTEETRKEWNENKEWWEPVVYFEDSEYYEDNSVDWLCDNVGDAQDAMEAMWAEILRLRKYQKTPTKIERLRNAGCTCPKPLIGYVGESDKLRCRVCNKKEE